MTTLLQRHWFSRRAPLPSPVSRLAPPLSRSNEGLVFTEWLVLGVLALAYLETISQPLFFVQLNQTFLAHFPLVLLGPALLLHMIGVLVNGSDLSIRRVVGTCWPLLALAAFALGGSLVAKYDLKVKETYLAFGIYLALVPLFMLLTSDSRRTHRWALALMCLSVVSSIAALAGQLARVMDGQLHEIEYLVVAGFFTLYYASRSGTVKFIAFALLVVAMVANNKLTGYFIAALAVMNIVLTAGWRRLPGNWRLLYALGALVFAVVVAAILWLLFLEFRQYLPTGNPEVRLKQYEAAMRAFTESPIWGYAYLQGSGEIYQESYRLLNIPTHSDVLDMLKHGGLIALGLFSWGYFKLFMLIHRAVKATVGDRCLNAYFLGARIFQVTALVEFSLNPILLKGPFLLVIWGNLGLAAGMALRVLAGARKGAAA